jgi:hypothetical protein
MTELLHMALIYANALDPLEQDRIAMAILAEAPLRDIRARLGEADAEFVADRYLDDCDALWEARYAPAEETIVF